MREEAGHGQTGGVRVEPEGPVGVKAVRKAVACVVRERPDVRELLVFTHPNGSVQLPKGSIDPDEHPRRAVFRELLEESGVSAVEVQADLGEMRRFLPAGALGTGPLEQQSWHPFLLAPTGPLPDRWCHAASGSPEEERLEFEYHWLPLPEATGVLHPLYHVVVEELERTAYRIPKPSHSARNVTRVWDSEYQGGRYRDEPPVPFVAEILDELVAARYDRSSLGLYVGCGNGRNYLPLIRAGMEIVGLDLSFDGLQGLRHAGGETAGHLVCGDFLAGAVTGPFDFVVSIQVFQHGDWTTATRHFEEVKRVLRPGGLFFLRVNSASTRVDIAHSVVDARCDGGRTVRYEAGSKEGLRVNFFSKTELLALVAPGLALVRPPREVATQRKSPRTGEWVQWEAICKRTEAVT
jgi:SAM-dependent methyltransferase